MEGICLRRQQTHHAAINTRLGKGADSNSPHGNSTHDWHILDCWLGGHDHLYDVPSVVLNEVKALLLNDLQ